MSTKEYKKLIIIPAYNEAKNLIDLIKEIESVAKDYDYIIINDCSTDNTSIVCEENKCHCRNLPTNLGIGGAVQTRYIYAMENNYDIAVQVDGDGQHNPEYLQEMFATLEDNHADMVVGSRFIENEGFQSSFMRRIGIGYFTGLIKIVTGENITDPTSGFRMIGRDLIREFAKDYPIDYPEPESVVEAIKSGYRVKEIPVMMKERQGGESSINKSKSVYYMIKVSLAILFECIRRHK